jgi:hypothetical protein
VLVLAIGLLAWVVTSAIGGDGPGVRGTAEGASAGGEAPAGEEMVIAAPSSRPPDGTGATAPSSTTTAPPTSQTGSPTQTPAPTAGPEPSPPISATAPPPTAAAAPPAPQPPAAPPPCPDASFGVYVETGAPEYRVGEKPLLRLVLANNGAAACARDISRSLRELVIMGADGARLWSSNDCYSRSGGDTRLLEPGQRLAFTVTWAGRTSAPGCPVRRGTVQAGTYQVVGRVGGLVGQPVPLILR